MIHVVLCCRHLRRTSRGTLARTFPQRVTTRSPRLGRPAPSNPYSPEHVIPGDKTRLLPDFFLENAPGTLSHREKGGEKALLFSSPESSSSRGSWKLSAELRTSIVLNSREATGGREARTNTTTDSANFYILSRVTPAAAAAAAVAANLSSHEKRTG